MSAIQLSNQSDSKKRIRRSSLPEVSWFCIGALLWNMDSVTCKGVQLPAMHADFAAPPAAHVVQDDASSVTSIARIPAFESQHLAPSGSRARMQLQQDSGGRLDMRGHSPRDSSECCITTHPAIGAHTRKPEMAVVPQKGPAKGETYRYDMHE